MDRARAPLRPRATITHSPRAGLRTARAIALVRLRATALVRFSLRFGGWYVLSFPEHRASRAQNLFAALFLVDRLLPAICFAPIVGTLADRIDKRFGMATCDLLSAVSVRPSSCGEKPFPLGAPRVARRGIGSRSPAIITAPPESAGIPSPPSRRTIHATAGWRSPATATRNRRSGNEGRGGGGDGGAGAARAHSSRNGRVRPNGLVVASNEGAGADARARAARARAAARALVFLRVTVTRRG